VCLCPFGWASQGAGRISTYLLRVEHAVCMRTAVGPDVCTCVLVQLKVSSQLHAALGCPCIVFFLGCHAAFATSTLQMLALQISHINPPFSPPTHNVRLFVPKLLPSL